MKHCPITLEPLQSGEQYSRNGLRSIHPKLTGLQPLQLSQTEQLRQARLRAVKMSIQGVQPKLSAKLGLKAGAFRIVDNGGKFILKPNPPQFHEVPQNESLTMSMAAAAGITVPAHGLIPDLDDGWVYFIKRFDRQGRNKRIHVEDFAQLSGATRETKYNSSLEQVAGILETYATFPVLEKPKLARRLLFCFLTGNEDMHLKNFSIWVRDGVCELAPAYDFLNTTLVLEKAVEESALPMNGKKSRLKGKDWIDYLCHKRLGLKLKEIDSILEELQNSVPFWWRQIDASYLSESHKEAYKNLLMERCQRLGVKIA